MNKILKISKRLKFKIQNKVTNLKNNAEDIKKKIKKTGNLSTSKRIRYGYYFQCLWNNNFQIIITSNCKRCIDQFNLSQQKKAKLKKLQNNKL